MSEAIGKEAGVEDANVKIYPSSGYGNSMFLRAIIKQEKPDMLMMFTDPRYWFWLFNMEREIRATMPIIYYNIWDDLPYPMYNKAYYESCDGLFAISKQTLNINKQVLGEKLANQKTLKYIPHGVSAKFGIIEDEAVKEDTRSRLFGDTRYDFTLFYNARNISRKRPGDLVLMWRHFCDLVGKEKARKCCFLLHTDAVDQAGTDIPAVIHALTDPDYVNIKILDAKINTEELNKLYAISDGVILISSNEGWGLSATEALLTGKMLIGSVTGGIQDQMRFEDESGNWIDFTKDFPSNHNGTVKKHGEWAIPVYPSNRCLAGSPVTPYIYDDRVKIEDTAEAIKHLYELGSEEREKRGRAGHDWAVGDEAGFTAAKMGERFIEALDEAYSKWKNNPRERAELIQITNETGTVSRVDYNPIAY